MNSREAISNVCINSDGFWGAGRAAQHFCLGCYWLRKADDLEASLRVPKSKLSTQS